MADLALTRTKRPEVKKLAESIKGVADKSMNQIEERTEGSLR